MMNIFKRVIEVENSVYGQVMRRGPEGFSYIDFLTRRSVGSIPAHPLTADLWWRETLDTEDAQASLSRDGLT